MPGSLTPAMPAGTTRVFALAGSRARCPQKAGELHPTAQGQEPPFPESCVGHVGSSSEDCVYQDGLDDEAGPAPSPLTCIFTPTGPGVLPASFSLVFQETHFQALKLAWGKRPSPFRLAVKKEFIEFLFAMGLWLNPCSRAPCWGNSEFTGPGLGRSPWTSLRPNLSTVFFQCLTGPVLPVLSLVARSPNSVLRYAVTFRPSRGSSGFVLCASACLARGLEPPLCGPSVAHRAEEDVLAAKGKNTCWGLRAQPCFPPFRAAPAGPGGGVWVS